VEGCTDTSDPAWIEQDIAASIKILSLTTWTPPAGRGGRAALTALNSGDNKGRGNMVVAIG
jgi:hypothetical protein